MTSFSFTAVCIRLTLDWSLECGEGGVGREKRSVKLICANKKLYWTYSKQALTVSSAHTQREWENKVKGFAGAMRRRNRTHGLRLMSSLKFSGALFLFRLSASHLSLVHVIWTFSGGASTTSSSSSEYRLPIRTKECLSFTSWACECQGGYNQALFVYMQVCYEQQLTSTSREDSAHEKKTWQQWSEINIPLFVFLHWTASFASTSGTSAPSLTSARRCTPRCHCHAARVQTSF